MAETSKSTVKPVAKKPVKKAKPLPKKGAAPAAASANVELEKKVTELTNRVEKLEAGFLNNIETEQFTKEFKGRFAKAEKTFSDWISDAPLQKVLLIVAVLIFLMWLF